LRTGVISTSGGQANTTTLNISLLTGEICNGQIGIKYR